MTRPLLEAIELKKHYRVPGKLFQRPHPVARSVDGVNFAVPEGETLGLIGESGCGKSTTAKLLLRLESPTGGQIRFDGEDVQTVRGKALGAYRRQVQAVFQDPYSSLNPRRTVFQAIAEPLVAAGEFTKAEIAARVAELIDVVGLPANSAERLPHEFSGGQRQRIAIARGLALQPRLLILDEPVSALDVSIRAQILNLLSDLQERFGLTYLLISHDLEVVQHMSSNVAVMYLGKIVERGTTAQVMETPQHPYTKALLSSVLPPHPDRRRERIRLFGPLPSPIDPPSGCVFRTRCPNAQPVCAISVPPVVKTVTGSTAACHFAEAAA
ncbi:oligopeptide/dipeptide ABC transporter ATP-binding protein [Sphingomonas sp. G-3-2-10]|uniref:ABC transporter ATP-binding protein n=1 Tax=Sphingomonas sp. G-3-2-10 TaxID=2728838 RepID=UPI00146D115F|nr:oligopeptide/dipeptide ABC transporter ATP-binding protein [Sphingomonas sp. G-3-2-10]NML08168.1 ATP-binding cassette domain-containing protein [Sphingomonas sp. G-3-2-10]